MKRLFYITWDDVKAQRNRLKHGVAFDEAAAVLRDPLALTVYDAAHSETEDRWFTLGRTGGGQLLAVAHSYRILDENSATIRLISARKATRRERRQYENKP